MMWESPGMQTVCGRLAGRAEDRASRHTCPVLQRGRRCPDPGGPVGASSRERRCGTRRHTARQSAKRSDLRSRMCVAVVAAGDELFIHGLVLPAHPGGGEMAFDRASARPTVNAVDFVDPATHRVDVVAEEAGQLVLNDLRGRTM